MKTKQTQILGLYIVALLILISFDFYTIYSLVNYGKLATDDVVTSFAVVDALFYQSIKFFIVSYLIFYVSIEIKDQFAERERLRTTREKLEKRNEDKSENDLFKELRKRGITVIKFRDEKGIANILKEPKEIKVNKEVSPELKESIQASFKQNLGNETIFVGHEDKFEPLNTIDNDKPFIDTFGNIYNNGQGKVINKLESTKDFEETKKDIIESGIAAGLKFEEAEMDDPLLELIQLAKRYGKLAVEKLTIIQRKFLVLDPPTAETLQSLYVLDAYYRHRETEPIEGEKLSWQNVINDIKNVKEHVFPETEHSNQ